MNEKEIILTKYKIGQSPAYIAENLLKERGAEERFGKKGALKSAKKYVHDIIYADYMSNIKSDGKEV